MRPKTKARVSEVVAEVLDNPALFSAVLDGMRGDDPLSNADRLYLSTHSFKFFQT